MSLRLNYGKKKNAPVEDKSRVTIDWDAIAQTRRERIAWEIEQGLNPTEAHEVTPVGSSEPAKPKKRSNNYDWINRNGMPRKYDHEAMIKLYVEEGLNGKQVAERLGANPATVYGVLKKAGVTREYNGGHNGFNTELRS